MLSDLLFKFRDTKFLMTHLEALARQSDVYQQTPKVPERSNFRAQMTTQMIDRII